MRRGESARSIVRTSAAASGRRREFEQELAPKWKESKKSVETIDKRDGRMRSIVCQVKGTPANELLLVDMSMVIPVGELMDPREQWGKVPDDHAQKPFPGWAMVQQMIKKGWTDCCFKCKLFKNSTKKDI